MGKYVCKGYWTPRDQLAHVFLVYYNPKTTIIIRNEYISQLPGSGFYKEFVNTYIDLFSKKMGNRQAEILFSDNHKDIQQERWKVNFINLFEAK